MLKAVLSTSTVALMLCACASTGNTYSREDRYFDRAHPGEIVAAEVRFAQLARKEGQWTAFRETMGDDARMFVPEMVSAKQWLSGKSDPARSVDWQAHRVTMSCDGSLAVTYGAWQRPDGSTGYFYTVWERQKKRDYKWVFDFGEPTAEPISAPDPVETSIADCGDAPTAEIPDERSAPVSVVAHSDDKTLYWTAGQNRVASLFDAWYWKDGRYQRFASQQVEIPQK